MSEPTVREQVLRALDPKGEMQQMLQLVRRLPAIDSASKLHSAVAEWEANVATVEKHWLPLTDRGWGVANVGLPTIREAGALLDANDPSAADAAMSSWFDMRMRQRVAWRVRAMNDGGTDSEVLYEGRARLIEEASALHELGHFSASVMIVLAQVEGITAQVTAPLEGGRGKLFFTRSPTRMADVVDESDLASIHASLDRLRLVYSSGVDVAQMSSSLSRHGILHGQELAFGNAANAAKCWSLIDVLVQWAMPRARERWLRADVARGNEFAGSKEMDERGRRLDAREFRATRQALYDLSANQAAYAFRERRFDSSATDADLDSRSLEDRGLPDPHGIQLHSDSSGLSWWAMRRTVSGWWLGRALTHNDSGHVDHWYYAGPAPPSGGPTQHASQWGEPNVALPDWEGGE